MNKINIHLDDTDSLENYSVSVDNSERKEMMWNKKIETLLWDWYKEIKIKMSSHSKNGKNNKHLYNLVGVPSVLLPIVLTGLGPVIPCNSLFYSLSMMVISFFTGMNLFFNFSKKESLHDEYSNKFFELSCEIESELNKPKCSRLAADVYLERTKNKYNSLCNQAPTI